MATHSAFELNKLLGQGLALLYWALVLTNHKRTMGIRSGHNDVLLLYGCFASVWGACAYGRRVHVGLNSAGNQLGWAPSRQQCVMPAARLIPHPQWPLRGLLTVWRSN